MLPRQELEGAGWGVGGEVLGKSVPPPHHAKCLADEVSQSQKVPRETDSCWMAWLLGDHIPSEEAEHSEED